jgi:MFS family permease
MTATSGNIHRFIGFHSFLIGLFPFYIPVYLWKMGITLSGIAFFIALTGVGFCIALWMWDRLHKRISLRTIIALSFILEGGVLSLIFWGERPFFLPVFALLNGAYTSFFWTTQRVLFFQTIRPTDSGKKYGNLQIIVVLSLKSGIFIGGLLLDRFGYSIVFLLSSLVTVSAVIAFLSGNKVPRLPPELLHIRPLSIAGVVRFKDDFRSKSVFILDGLFLYLESYFWMISLFLIVQESFWELGILVIGLMILFALLFLVIKNAIDRLPATLFYRISVLLYALSWLLRGWADERLGTVGLLLFLILIAFFTSLFRLSFNKRFFDLALSTTSYRYLIYKSYYSQAALAVLFGIVGAIILIFDYSETVLKTVYFVSAMIASGYVVYGKRGYRPGFRKRAGHNLTTRGTHPV